MSVSGAGDINGDSVDDLVIGALDASPSGRTWAGKSYVVFGSKNVSAWGNGLLDLSSLHDGYRGFVLQGEAASDFSGRSVSGAGDINGDGVADLVIGAFMASPGGRAQAGKSYVVFGSQNRSAWGNGVLDLGSLSDGHRGFVLQGEAGNDWSGLSVSGAGDINGDGVTDLVIGAYHASPSGRMWAGKSYVVFGSQNRSAWGNGVLDLGSLSDGRRGFVLQGEAGNDWSGLSVSGAGDINGDGVADLVIGAPEASPSGRAGAGKSYVVLGSQNRSAWGNGVLDLGSLSDGYRGFVLEGEVSDFSGASVSSAGDINGDGVADLVVGAYLASPGGRAQTGKSYVVFGGGLAVSKQQLPLYSGQTLRLGVQHLNLTYLDPQRDNSGLQYSVQSTLLHGRFEWVLQPGFPITQFTQADITQNKVQFVHDGSAEVPVYQLQVNEPLYARTLPGFVQFNAHPVFINNSFPINQGQPLVITTDYLAVTDRESPLSYLTLSVNNQQNGRFQWINGTQVMQWNPLNITAGVVRFMPDGSASDPSFTLSINDQVNTFSVLGQIDFDRAPTLVNNLLAINQGVPLTLNPSMLSATDPDGALGDLRFVITALQYGSFKQFNGSTLIASNLTDFIQQAVVDGQMQFWHDGSSNPPSYRLAVSDGRITIPSVPAVINFNYAPVLTLNPFIIDQGQATRITPNELSAEDRETPAVNLVFGVSNVTAGYFEYSSNTGFAIQQFLQSQVTTGNVQFVQNGSDSTPTFAFNVSDGSIWTVPQRANITLNRRPLVQKSIPDHTVEENQGFSFTLDPDTFHDPDGNPLSWNAVLEGNIPLPSEITFNASAHRFAGLFKTLSTESIVVKASDPRGLTAQTGFKLQTVAGINYQAWLSALSTLGGVLLTMGGYFWWRRTTAQHRQAHDLANYLRKVLNLYYHDFDRQDGDVYKLKIERLINELNKYDHFYEKMNDQQRQSFAVCIGEIIRVQGYLASAKCGNGLLAWLLCFSRGWPVQLDLKTFDRNISRISSRAVTAWSQEVRRQNGNPLTLWRYHPSTGKDKCKAYCCVCCTRKKTSAMFNRRQEERADLPIAIVIDRKNHPPLASQELIEPLLPRTGSSIQDTNDQKENLGQGNVLKVMS